MPVVHTFDHMLLIRTSVRREIAADPLEQTLWSIRTSGRLYAAPWK